MTPTLSHNKIVIFSSRIVKSLTCSNKSIGDVSDVSIKISCVSCQVSKGPTLTDPCLKLPLRLFIQHSLENLSVL